MKVVILAGGLGTRISEESHLRPKPMIEIGGKPILWHIMKIYSYHGFNEFIICCGYRGYMIKEYFADYYLHCSDVTFDFSHKNEMIIHNNVAEPWRVTLVDTGLHTQTGGRIKRIEKYIDEDTFMLTYGDGVCDVDIQKLVTYHHEQGLIGTMTAVQPGGRYGVLNIETGNKINCFTEKSKEDGGWINGGFMVLNKEIFQYLNDDPNLIFERSPLEKLAHDGQLAAFKHDGFWKCMDTLRDKVYLEQMWENEQAKWKLW